MTIEFLPRDVGPSSPIRYYQENNEAIERIFPLDADWISRVWAGSIDWSDGTIVPIENLPIEDILNLITITNQIGVDIGVVTGLDVKWALDLATGTTFYVSPGLVAHRGTLKRQPLDEDTSVYRLLDTVASLRDVAADGDGGGLFADTWYYVYADVSVATSYPGIKVSRTKPTNDEGYGLEHPAETTLRYIGILRTDATGKLEAIQQYGFGRHFWVRKILGPASPTDNLSTRTTGPIRLDLGDHVPPIADSAFFTCAFDNFMHFSVEGSGGSRSAPFGYQVFGNLGDQGMNFIPQCTWLEVPVCTIDDSSGLPRATAAISFDNQDAQQTRSFFAVVGFNVTR